MLHLLSVLFVLVSPTGPVVEGSFKDSPSTDSIQKLQLQTVDVLSEKKTTATGLQRLDPLRRFEHSGTPLARQLEAVPGMSVLSSGTQLAKPVINGLHSQRILILQDGVRLEGQQWGSDHAPEIDPFQEGEWAILQAAASLRHGPEAIGGVLDLQAPPLLQHGHLDAHASTVWMSNNGLIGTHLRLQGPASRNGRLQWRWQGSNRMSGNLRLPGAYLANTGTREQSTTAELQYSQGKWLINNYLRLYHLRQGLYPGAHVENTEDLQRALESPEPLWEGRFGYQIQRPLQEVLHLQYSLRMQRSHSQGGLSSLRFGYQDNQRKEYDTRSFLPLPEMALSLGTHTASYTYSQNLGRWRIEEAVGLMFQQNLNQASNARQFIRNYQNQNLWGYSLLAWESAKMGRHEWALRFDQVDFESYYRAPGSQPNDPVTRDERSFHRWSAAWTWNYRVPQTAWLLSLNAGSGWRPPSAPEWYANGLHQGMAALELGNPLLGPEQTLTGNLGLEWKKNGRLFHSQIGRRQIDGFIFLEPQQPPAQTINGVYPRFAYVGKDASLTHWNNKASLPLGSGWRLDMSAALVRGRERNRGAWLVWMPADRWSVGIHHAPPRHPTDGSQRPYLRTLSGGVEALHVSRQSRVPLRSDNNTSLDYAPAPSAYTLVRIYAGGMGPGGHLQWMLSVDNLLNTRYRDYMNRLRYFSNEQGLNLSLRIQYHLHRHHPA